MTLPLPLRAVARPSQRAGTHIASERWLVAGLILLSLALHLFWIRLPRVVWGDEPSYLWLGRNWLTGQGYQFLGFTDVHHPPLYPLLSGLLYLLTHNSEIASDILYVVLGPLLVLPIYDIGRRLYGPRAGLLAGLLVALWPVFNAAVPWWGTMTEPPFYLFVAVGLWAAVVAADIGPAGHHSPEGIQPAVEEAGPRPHGRHLWAWLVAGFAFGLAYLTRPEGIWYVPSVGGALLLSAWMARFNWRRWLGGGALFALGFLLCLFPYAVHERIYTGSWMVSEKVGITFQDSLALARDDIAEHDRVLWQLDSTGKQVYFFSPESFHLSMLDQIRADPRGYARVLYLNVKSLLRMFFTTEDFVPAFLPLLALGLFGAVWTRRRLRGEILLLAGLLPPLSFLLFFIFTRYVSPLLLPMLVWTGLGLEKLSDWTAGTLVTLWPGAGSGWRRFAWGLPVLAAAAILLVLQPVVSSGVQDTQAVRWEHRAAGEWLASHAPAGAVVMARYPTIAFYADRQWAPSPNSDYQAALRYAAARNASYWVVDGNEKRWRPLLASLADGQPGPGLELLYTVPSEGPPVYIYRIQSSGNG